jgi:hypothetical protein
MIRDGVRRAVGSGVLFPMLPPISRAWPRVSAQRSGAVEIVNFLLPSRHRGRNRIKVCLSPLFAKPELFLKRVFAKSFNRVGHVRFPIALGHSRTNGVPQTSIRRGEFASAMV